MGEGSISAFITADKRELLLRDDTIVKNSDFSFVQQSYYTEAMNEMAATIIDYVTYNGQQYLFMLSKSYQNGSAICAMVPMNLVRAGANSIRGITIFMVLCGMFNRIGREYLLLENCFYYQTD